MPQLAESVELPADEVQQVQYAGYLHDIGKVGVPSELTEEEVLAIVQLHEGAELSPVELLDHCQDRMAHFAVPRYVRLVDAMPRTPSQRIEKYKLRAEGLTDDTWDRESVGYEVRR